MTKHVAPAWKASTALSFDDARGRHLMFKLEPTRASIVDYHQFHSIHPPTNRPISLRPVPIICLVFLFPSCSLLVLVRVITTVQSPAGPCLPENSAAFVRAHLTMTANH